MSKTPFQLQISDKAPLVQLQEICNLSLDESANGVGGSSIGVPSASGVEVSNESNSQNHHHVAVTIHEISND